MPAMPDRMISMRSSSGVRAPEAAVAEIDARDGLSVGTVAVGAAREKQFMTVFDIAGREGALLGEECHAGEDAGSGDDDREKSSGPHGGWHPFDDADQRVEERAHATTVAAAGGPDGSLAS